MLVTNSTDEGSTVIQRRVDGSVDFDQTWNKYEQGFGDLESKYFFHLPKHSTRGIGPFFPHGFTIIYTDY